MYYNYGKIAMENWGKDVKGVRKVASKKTFWLCRSRDGGVKLVWNPEINNLGGVMSFLSPVSGPTVMWDVISLQNACKWHPWHKIDDSVAL